MVGVPGLLVLPGAVRRLEPSVFGARLEGHALGPFLSGVVEGLEDGSVTEDDVAPADAILGLTGALFGQQEQLGLGGAGESASSALPGRVTSYIDGHLHEAGLGPERIAAAPFVSTRYLHELFESEELTLFRWVQHRRLERCCQDLRDEAVAGSSIASSRPAGGSATGTSSPGRSAPPTAPPRRSCASRRARRQPCPPRRPADRCRRAGRSRTWTGHPPAGMLELIAWPPAMEEMFGRFHQASIDWDGSDPVRPFG